MGETGPEGPAAYRDFTIEIEAGDAPGTYRVSGVQQPGDQRPKGTFVLPAGLDDDRVDDVLAVRGLVARSQAWLNAADVRDPVALYSRLEGDVFPGDIENLNDIANPPDNPHGVEGYLRDHRLARRIAAALGS